MSLPRKRRSQRPQQLPPLPQPAAIRTLVPRPSLEQSADHYVLSYQPMKRKISSQVRNRSSGIKSCRGHRLPPPLRYPTVALETRTRPRPARASRAPRASGIAGRVPQLRFRASRNPLQPADGLHHFSIRSPSALIAADATLESVLGPPEVDVTGAATANRNRRHSSSRASASSRSAAPGTPNGKPSTTHERTSQLHRHPPPPAPLRARLRTPHEVANTWRQDPELQTTAT